PPLLRSISLQRRRLPAAEAYQTTGSLPRLQAQPRLPAQLWTPRFPNGASTHPGTDSEALHSLPTAATTHTHTAPVLQASGACFKGGAGEEATEGMGGRVDEGVEEFFTKRIIPDYALKGRTTVTSPSVPSTDTCFTSTDVPLLSTSSTPPAPPSSVTPTTTIPTKNIKKKFGDFFAFKRARGGRAPKAGGGEGGGEGVKVKRTSIADLIRPLQGTAAPGQHPAGDAKGTMAPAKTLTTTTPSSDTTPSFPNTATSPDLTTATLSNLTGEAVPLLPGPPSSPVVTSPLTEQERGGVQMKEMLGGSPFGERRLKVTKRSLREGKSQSLILLTGLEPEDKDDTHSKKHASESTSSFEQRLQVMLHRMGVAKTPPADTKTSQNKDEELRKTNSEGAILDKPVPPPTYMKPRTMSTSSADPRHPMRALDPIRPDPPIHPKPTVHEHPVGPLPPKPAVAAKPPLPTPASPAGGATRPSSAPPPSSSAGRVQLRHIHDGRLSDTTAQNGSQERPPGAASALSPRKELLPSAPSAWRGPGTQERSEKAQSVTDESLPKTRQHLKPVLKRRAVSVHEDTLAMTQELKAVLQRSPIRFRGSRGDLPPCTEDPPCVEEAQRPQEAGHAGKREEKRKTVQDEEELKAERGRMGCGAETKPPPPGSACPSSTEASAARLFSPTAASDRPPPVLERLTHGLQKPPPPVPQEEKPGTAPPPEEGRTSTQEELSKQHTVKAADQRTEPPLSE
ncbi:hypothetical protein KUCAC02_021912, partial [Chaenocephalus aceratus]